MIAPTAVPAFLEESCLLSGQHRTYLLVIMGQCAIKDWDHSLVVNSDGPIHGNEGIPQCAINPSG
jgi:hypothetical protein